MRTIIILLLLAVFSLPFTGCQEKIVAQDDVHQLLDSLEYKLDWLHYKLSLEEWELRRTGSSDSLSFYQGLYRYTIANDSVAGVLRRNENLLKDEEDYRRWQLLYEAVQVAQLESSPEIATLRDSLLTIQTKYRPLYDGEMVSRNTLYSIYQSDRNRTKREEAYRGYVSSGTEIEDGLKQLMRLRSQAAKKQGYNSYMSLIFTIYDIDLDEYKQLLENLEEMSREPYRELLNRIKSKLNVQNVEQWDLEYATSDVRTAVDRYFPVDSQMKFISRSLEDIGFDLDKLPIYADYKNRPGNAEFASAFTVNIPDEMRILANLQPGIQSTKALMHQVGYTIHAAYINQDKPLFQISVDDAWAEGMAQIFTSMLDEPEWLNRYARIPSNLIEQYERSLEEQNLITLRQLLVTLYFELEAYQNPGRDLNKLYWDLVEQYMYLPRHDDLAPWASVSEFTAQPVYLQNYLYADMITAQTVAFLHETYGPLTQSQTTRSFLVQNYFRFGAKYEWRELLKRGIDAELDYRYYAAEFLPSEE